MKDLKIEVPEGYEIDKKKSTFERIVFKKKDSRVRRWVDFDYIRGCFITKKSEIISVGGDCTDYDRNLFPTIQDAESALALAQLLQFRQQWINDYDTNWKPVWDGNTKNWCINRSESDICVYGFYSQYYELSFPTKEMAEDFLDTFEELLRVYFKV